MLISSCPIPPFNVVYAQQKKSSAGQTTEVGSSSTLSTLALSRSDSRLADGSDLQSQLDYPQAPVRTIYVVNDSLSHHMEISNMDFKYWHDLVRLQTT